MMSLVVVLALPAPVSAQSATDSANSKLDDLKARLATKVAELRTLVKRAMYGTVKSVSLSSASIETKTKDIKIELTDEVTVSQLISGKRTNIDIEDVAVGDPVTVFGTYDETLDLLKAQYIFIESSAVTQRVHGTIVDADAEDFVLTIMTSEGRTVTADFEKTTKTTMWTTSGGFAKGGFSKLSVGDTVHITGKPNTKTENRMSAIRILDLGNITSAATEPKVAEPADAANTPSATPRATPTLRQGSGQAATPKPSVTP